MPQVEAHLAAKLCKGASARPVTAVHSIANDIIHQFQILPWHKKIVQSVDALEFIHNHVGDSASLQDKGAVSSKSGDGDLSRQHTCSSSCWAANAGGRAGAVLLLVAEAGM